MALLLGIANSSAACFWMKQVFHCKGIRGEGEYDGRIVGQFYAFDATKLKLFPIPTATPPLSRGRVLDRVARVRAERSIESVLTSDGWTRPPSCARASTPGAKPTSPTCSRWWRCKKSSTGSAIGSMASIQPPVAARPTRSPACRPPGARSS
ncbi:MAG: hypothetical protein R3B06_03805 [Kofleriaceae bacterium]